MNSPGKEVRKQIYFIIVPPKIRYVGITKEVKDFFIENFKTLKKETKTAECTYLLLDDRISIINGHRNNNNPIATQCPSKCQCHSSENRGKKSNNSYGTMSSQNNANRVLPHCDHEKWLALRNLTTKCMQGCEPLFTAGRVQTSTILQRSV